MECAGKWISFLVGCFATALVGAKMVFNVYQNDLKETFNYTQSEVAVMSSMLSIGGGLGIIPGVMYDRVGPRLVSSIGLIFVSASYCLIWSTTQMVDFYRSRSWMQDIYFLGAGLGGTFLYSASLNTSIVNFSVKYRSIIVGVINGFLMGSPALYILLFHEVFANNTRDTACVRYSRFIMLFFVLAIICGILSVACIHIVKETGEPTANSPFRSDKNSKYTEESEFTDDNKTFQESFSFKHLLKDIKFCLFSIFFTVGLATILAFIPNITTTTKSMGYGVYEMFILLITPIADTLSGILAGYLYDKTESMFRRTLYAGIATLACTISGILSTFAVDSLTSFVISTVFNGIAAGVLYSVALPYLASAVGPHHFGTAYGILITSTSVLQFLIQAVFGVLYDSKRGPADGITCYGTACVQSGYALLLGLDVVAFILSLVFSAMSRRQSTVALLTPKEHALETSTFNAE